MADGSKQHTKVLVLTRYGRNGASSRTRHYNFDRYLREYGIDFTFAPLLSERYLECLYGGLTYPKINIIRHYIHRLTSIFHSGKFDVIWCEKEALPYIPGWLEKLLLPTKIPIVLDFDDAWWFRYSEHPNTVLRTVLVNKFETIIKNATVITASNELLVEQIRKMGGRDVRLIPVALAVDEYSRAAEKYYSDLEGPIKVGWIGTPFTANIYLPMIVDVINDLVNKKIIEMHLIGAGDAVPQLNAIRHEWSESTEIDLISKHDVGIMPLRDDAFSRGKSAYKLLQYMACGKPVIGSPVGTNQFLFEGYGKGDILGFSAENEKEWNNIFLFLAENRKLMVEVGQRCRRYIDEKHSLEMNAKEVGKIFNRYS